MRIDSEIERIDDKLDLLQEMQKHEAQGDHPIIMNFFGGNSMGASGPDHELSGQNTNRCNLSMLSNYLLYLIFLTTTFAYLFFAIRLATIK